MAHRHRPARSIAVRAVLTATLAATWPSSTPADPPATERPAVVEARHRGVSWVAGRPVDASTLEPLQRHHVDWMVQTPFGWQDDHDTPEVRLVTDGHVLWGETDRGLEVTTELARAAGIRTLLKPHVWLVRPSPGKWRSDIAMRSEADWRRWFSSYRRWMLHYARLAQRLRIEALCIGTELRGTVRTREKDWRSLIREIRGLYDGQLTYAANWYAEFEEVPFWDALDYVGVQAYFPLSTEPRPGLEALRAGWQPHLDALERTWRRHRRPILFTEIGYRSMPDAAIEPWRWPQASDRETVGVDLATQERAYEAFFGTVWEQPWFAGAYFWKWFPRHARAGGERSVGFTPQNKPAEQVLGRWYARAARAATPTAQSRPTAESAP